MDGGKTSRQREREGGAWVGEFPVVASPFIPRSEKVSDNPTRKIGGTLGNNKNS